MDLRHRNLKKGNKNKFEFERPKHLTEKYNAFPFSCIHTLENILWYSINKPQEKDNITQIIIRFSSSITRRLTSSLPCSTRRSTGSPSPGASPRSPRKRGRPSRWAPPARSWGRGRRGCQLCQNLYQYLCRPWVRSYLFVCLSYQLLPW